MLLKVEGGTPKGSSPSLCMTCRNATVIHGTKYTIIECSELSSAGSKQLMEIQPITRCSYYDDKSKPSLSHMTDIAWELKPNKKTGKLGFQMPEEKRHKVLFNPVAGRDEY